VASCCKLLDCDRYVREDTRPWPSRRTTGFADRRSFNDAAPPEEDKSIKRRMICRNIASEWLVNTSASYAGGPGFVSTRKSAILTEVCRGFPLDKRQETLN
jgi:hypothetical protein